MEDTSLSTAHLALLLKSGLGFGTFGLLHLGLDLG